MFPEGGEREIHIEFIPKPEFQFSVSLVGEEFQTTEAPSDELLTQANIVREEVSDCVIALRHWLKRIEEEYRSANPIVDEFESFRQSINERIRSHVEDEHGHFTPEEATAMRAKLDELTQRIAELAERSDGFEHRLAEAKKQIDSLKPDLDTASRGVWLRRAGSKTLNALKAVITSKEGREFALQAAKQFLLGAPKYDLSRKSTQPPPPNSVCRRRCTSRTTKLYNHVRPLRPAR